MDKESREVFEVSARWDDAIRDRDVAAASQILHDEYALVLVQPAKSTMPREQWLALLPDYVVHEWEVQDQVIDADRDVAAVLQRVNMRATVSGQDRSGVFVTSDFWQRTNAGWKVWRRHSTPLSAGELSTSH